MNADDYQKAALRTYGYKQLHDEDRQFVTMLNLAQMGLSGESGEFCEQIKKWMFHGHPLSYDKLEKELGDILWYVAVAAYALNLPLSEVMEANQRKLRERYPHGFSSNASIHRTGDGSDSGVHGARED